MVHDIGTVASPTEGDEHNAFHTPFSGADGDDIDYRALVRYLTHSESAFRYAASVTGLPMCAFERAGLARELTTTG